MTAEIPTTEASIQSTLVDALEMEPYDGAEAMAALGKIIEAWEAWQETMNHNYEGRFGSKDAAQAFGLALTKGKELLEGKKS